MATNRPDRPPREYTYRDRHLSMWQSAAKSVARKTSVFLLRTRDMAVEELEDHLMTPVHNLYSQLARAGDGTRFLMSFSLRESAAGDCAELAMKFLAAEMSHNAKLAAEITDRLKKSTCDVLGWKECVEEYLRFKLHGGKFPYREHKNVLRPLPDVASIAIIGDWGTGEHQAVHLLSEVAKQRPNILIHLGDVYYSGTEDEMKHNFLQICQEILPDTKLFTLCGNHDMYAGGNAYYSLLDTIGQDASYFSLSNDYWQILAMDTGNNDRSPFTVATNMTSLHDSEAKWHREKILGANGRKTILMSHHQLFSPFGAVGQIEHRGYSYNPLLFDDFKDVLGGIEWWFWGHEHNLAVYEPHMGLKRGRCVGASAIPVLKSQQSYSSDTSLQTLGSFGLPKWNPKSELPADQYEYIHAFAMMKLEKESALVEYYGVPFGMDSSLILTDI